MCIPIGLNVPVLTVDGSELGTASDILCPYPHADELVAGAGYADPLATMSEKADLWLRVERAGADDLFVPFREILEVRPEGVRLGVSSYEVPSRDWSRVPAGLAVDAVPA